MLSEQQREDLAKARDDTLGPKKDRTPEKPMKRSGYQGGTAWERDDGAKHVTKNPKSRAYTLGMSYQTRKRVVGPSAGCRLTRGGTSAHQELRGQLVNVRLMSLS